MTPPFPTLPLPSTLLYAQENLLNRVPTASLSRLKNLENLTLDTNLIIELNNEAFLGKPYSIELVTLCIFEKMIGFKVSPTMVAVQKK